MLRALATTVALAAAATAAQAGTPAPAFVASIQVLSAQSSEGAPLKVATGHGAMSLPAGSSSFAAADVRSFEVGGVTIALDGTVTYDGASTPPEGSAVQLLSAPRIVTPAGQTVSVRSGSQGGQYFEAGDDGCYRLREVPPAEQPGLRLELELDPVSGSSSPQVRVVHNLELVTLSGREPLPGVLLEVGRPRTRKASFNSNMTIDLGSWNLLGMFRAVGAADGGQGLLLVLLKVEVVPPHTP